MVRPRTCSKCRVQKDISEFYLRKDRQQHTTHCKVCILRQNKANRDRRAPELATYRRVNKHRHAAAQKVYYRTHQEKWRDSSLKKAYGLTLQAFDALVQKQEGRCAICLEVPSEVLHVDHNHTTNVIRGLLCRACNFALGLFKDNPEIANRAIAYLQKDGLDVQR